MFAAAVQALQQHGGLQHLQCSGRRKVRDSASQVPCAALVSVAAGTEMRGPLTPWCRQARLLWHSMLDPADAFSLRVSGVVNFEPPLFVSSGLLLIL